MDIIVGIDLGTTNSEIAVINNGKVEIIKDNDNGILPSCVGIDKDNKIIIGQKALNQALLYPENTIRSVKRHMGKDTVFKLGENEFTAVEISALILKELKRRAENYTRKKISKAVITVPAYFTDGQRNATKEAGEIAGLEVVRIINEPTAASIAYEKFDNGRKNIIVYDLGGGTFDVSIVKIENGVVEVLATAGNNMLGGDDFDLRVRDYFADYINEHYSIDVTQDKVAMARLLNAAEKAKKELSSSAFTIVEEDYIMKAKGRDIHFSLEFSRFDFEVMIKDYLDETISLVSEALLDSGLKTGDIDRIVFAGGSTRIPLISEMMEQKFSISPDMSIDPDLCVASGAGLQAGREMGLECSGVLLDVTPYTFGTLAADINDGRFNLDCFVPIIKKNTKLPASMTKVFSTISDGQDGVDVQIFQGENKNASKNVLIGNYFFKLSELPADSLVTLKYELDINGILKIEAVEKETGNKLNKVIKNAFKESSQIEINEKSRRLDLISGYENEKSEDTAAVPDEIDLILKKALEIIDQADEDDRVEIINLMEEIKTLLNEKEFEKAEEKSRELDEIIFYYE